VHKGNIMKFTEGAFRDWGYEVAGGVPRARRDRGRRLWDKHGGKVPEGKVMINDRIADAMFQQLLLRPDEYDVLATMNLNGDYLSDAARRRWAGSAWPPAPTSAIRVRGLRGHARHRAEVRRTRTWSTPVQ
jgi:isocitrate dehydrogenase